MLAIEYMIIFQSGAYQLKSDKFAIDWFAMGIQPEVAARWANLGFTPREAAWELTLGGSIEESERAADRQQSL